MPKKCFKKRGLTWWIKNKECKYNISEVSCVAGGGGLSCNPYSGDTICANFKPILCINKANVPRPPYAVPPCPGCAFSAYPFFYHGWSEGFIKVTKPVRGCLI